MVVKVGTFAALLSALLVMSARSPVISQTAPLPAPAFHLNSVDPDSAIALYTSTSGSPSSGART